ncbi:DUF4214 domain-containing protein [Pseudoduganella sp. OTU4001]|uniref:DUF4214 domain-containing protein n=1 Tax=Pseudoduganella sp. OTU4001 TaxID=3043854 RepID=UPI00313D78BB
MTTPTKIESIQQLYLAYLQRPADPLGLQYWMHIMDTQGIDAIGAAFAKSPEYRALTAGKSNAEVVETLYLNLFGQRPDAVGLAFYKNALDSGKTTVDAVAAEILKGAVGSDLEIVKNKVVATDLFTTALGIDPGNLLGYADYLSRGKDFVGMVSSDASLYNALAALPNVLELVMHPIGSGAQGAVAHDAYPSLPLNNDDAVQRLFLAYFDRPATVDELALWSDTYAKSGFAAVSKQLSQLKEYTDSVQNLSHAQVVDQLYMNLFGRHGESAGVAFYADALSSGKTTVDQLLLGFINGALGMDHDVLENRMIGAELFTTALKIEPQLIEIYNLYKVPGKAFLDTVTSDASLYQALRDLPKMLHEVQDMMNTPISLTQLIGVPLAEIAP